MADKTQSAASLRRQYEALAKQCGGFDRDTKALEHKVREEGKRLILARKDARKKLLDEKGRIYAALRETEQREAEEAAKAEAEKAAKATQPAASTTIAA